MGSPIAIGENEENEAVTVVTGEKCSRPVCVMSSPCSFDLEIKMLPSSGCREGISYKRV